MAECRSTKFPEVWLDHTFEEKRAGDWCAKGKDDYVAYCLFCQSPVPISNSGYSQLMQPAKTAKHRDYSMK